MKRLENGCTGFLYLKNERIVIVGQEEGGSAASPNASNPNDFYDPIDHSVPTEQ
jgi:hypothetical protein